LLREHCQRESQCEQSWEAHIGTVFMIRGIVT